MEGPNVGLVEAVKRLTDLGHRLHAIDMQWGRFFTNRLKWLEYTDQLFFWYHKTSNNLFNASKTFNANDTDFILGDDVGKLGRTMRLDRR
jgi:hypothetical protein